jgi:hypothetical protein
MPDKSPKDKQLIFTIDDDLHARFKIALFYDRMGQSTFIKHIIAGYLTNNKHLRDFMDEVLSKDLGALKKRNRKKDREEAAETVNDFALNDDEIENIFDLIESENPDL